MPVGITCGRGYVEEEASNVLLVSGDDDRGYYDPPDTGAGHAQPTDVCHRETKKLTGLSLLPLSESCPGSKGGVLH